MPNNVSAKAWFDPLEHVCGQPQKWRMSATDGECGRTLERKKAQASPSPARRFRGQMKTERLGKGDRFPGETLALSDT